MHNAGVQGCPRLVCQDSEGAKVTAADIDFGYDTENPTPQMPCTNDRDRFIRPQREESD